MTQHPVAAQALVDFVPTGEFFVGIDSDGCAMDIKHQECFTPCSIKHWDLQPVSTLARETALFVNLGSTTRGLNRWLALKQLLDLLRDRAEVAERGVTIPEYPELAEFLSAPGYPLSDKGIAAYAAEHPSDTLDRAMRGATRSTPPSPTWCTAAGRSPASARRCRPWTPQASTR